MAKEIFMYGLAAIFTTGFFMVFALAVFFEIPESNVRIIDNLLGALIVSEATIICYFFGSSKSSSDKDKIIKENNNKKV